MLASRTSYSNVMATVAVFLALGGGAYALTLGKNSVKRKNIAPGAISTKKLAKDAVTGAKAKESSFGTVPNAAKLGGVGAAGYVAGIDSIQRVKVETVPIGADGVTFSIAGMGTIQFQDCANPGGGSPGAVAYENDSAEFQDVMGTLFVSAVTPAPQYTGVAAGSFLQPLFVIPMSKSSARVELEVGSRGSPQKVLKATLAFAYDGSCHYTLWTSRTTEEQG